MVALAAVGVVAGCRLFVDLDGLERRTASCRRRDSGVDAEVNPPVDAGSDVETPDVKCPGTGGPTAKLIDTGTTRFCIDTSEVTNEQYDAFLKTNPTVPANPAFCAWVTTYTPSHFPYDSARKAYPVNNVSWCHAYAFCQWAGKRLCGEIGGGTLLPAEMGDGTKAEFIYASSKGGTQKYPYGNEYNGKACNGGNESLGMTRAVKALASGQADGVFDLAGNIHEWTDGCVPSVGSQ